MLCGEKLHTRFNTACKKKLKLDGRWKIMSILSTSPTATRLFDMNIAVALGDMNSAVILQQLDFWMKKEGVGVIVGGTKYIYNTYKDWTSQQFRWLSERQFRNAMDILRSLEIVEVIRHKSKQWNQTNYYSLNYDRLEEFLAKEKLESTETVELTVKAAQDDKSSHIEMTNSDSSIYRTKRNTKEKTTKQESDRHNNKSESIAAASPKKGFKREKKPKQSNPRTDQLTAVPSQIEGESENKELHPNKEKEVAQVDVLVNSKWRSLIPELDKAGIPINKTLKDLLKLYPAEQVESAIVTVHSPPSEKR